MTREVSHGVDEIGAARAGQFVYLMPVFGSALAVIASADSLSAQADELRREMLAFLENVPAA